jgi:CheY-like chemotaxis protein
VDPFFTTKEVGKGTGLGLSQVFGFVKQSGGHLAIYSEVGEGTTVKIYLPRSHGKLVEPSAPSERSSPPRGKPEELILVVEDEEGVRLTTVETLRDLGYTVVHAASGAEALEVLDRHGGVSLIFTDVVMPGMNGRELAEQIRSRYPGTPILFTTGYTPNAIVHDGRLDSDVALVTKPFTVDQLAAKVRAGLDRAGRAAGETGSR